jgi:transcriptional regulator with XRE-family HTH domain
LPADPQIHETSPCLDDAQQLEPPLVIPELLALAQALARARQAQGLSLEALAAKLHMGVEQLRAFEAADLTRLPEPVFVVAQARRIADTLAVDVGSQIESLRASDAFSALKPALSTEVFQQAARLAASSASTTQGEAGTPSSSRPWGEPGPRFRLWWLAPLLLGAGALAAATVVWQQPSLWRPLRVAQQRIAQQQSSPARPLKPTLAAPAPQAVAPQPAAQAPVALLISSRQRSWLTVRPLAGGKPLYRGSFVGERRFPLGEGLLLRAGRPDLVMVSQGAAAPRPLGKVSDIRWIAFRPEAPLGSVPKPKAPGQGPGSS